LYTIKGSKELILVYLLLAPTVLIITLFQLVPVAWNFVLSFTKGGTLSTPQFIGIDNYLKILSDRYFVDTLINTFQFAFTIIPLAVLIGLFLALFLNQLKYFKKWFLGFIFFPLIPATLISALGWEYVINTFGPINYLLKLVGIGSIDWLADPAPAFWTIVLFEIWRGVGFYVVVFYGAILNIPKDFYEAARIDGCPEFKMFRYITIPMIRPTIAFCLIMATIWNFQIFDSIYLLTQGGPLFETSTISWYIYSRAFIDNKVGLSATMAVVMFLIILIVSLVQMKMFKSDIEY
jgi:multiple sugar transport system permease protein